MSDKAMFSVLGRIVIHGSGSTILRRSRSMDRGSAIHFFILRIVDRGSAIHFFILRIVDRRSIFIFTDRIVDRASAIHIFIFVYHIKSEMIFQKSCCLKYRTDEPTSGLARMHFSMEFYCFTADVPIDYQEKCF